MESLAQYPQLVRDFATYKRSIQGCSPKTVNEYLLDLRTFLRFTKAEKEGLPTDRESLAGLDISGLDLAFFENISTMDIYNFLYYAGEERHNENTAKARKLSAIKAFYKFITVKRNLTEHNPAQNIESPKTKRQLPKFLSVDESLNLLNSINEDTTNKYRERDYCIITFLLNCGMRVSELAGISVTDIDDQLRSLRVLGKGAKERIIYLNEACQEALKAYLPIRLKTVTKNRHEPALFISRNGNRLNVKTVQHIVYKYLDSSGLGYKHYSAHKLRHTAATLMYQSGEVDIRVLKDILGHEQLTTTQIYTHVSNEHMEEAMSKNPLASAARLKKAKTLQPYDEDPSDKEE